MGLYLGEVRGHLKVNHGQHMIMKGQSHLKVIIGLPMTMTDQGHLTVIRGHRTMVKGQSFMKDKSHHMIVIGQGHMTARGHMKVNGRLKVAVIQVIQNLCTVLNQTI